MREAIFETEAPGAYSRLKFEGGVHRVQRVPETESGGRIHTSTATVAVLAEADEVEGHIDEKDLRVDVYRATGPAGHSVTKTDSAVRITHLPPERRVPAHRIGMDLHNLPGALDGDLDRLIDALITTDQAQRLSVFAEVG